MVPYLYQDYKTLSLDDRKKIQTTWRGTLFACIAYEQNSWKEVVWAGEKWFRQSEHYWNHFTHIAINNPELVAYTETEEKGERDIQTPIKPGRYLTKYFSDVLTPEEIATWAAKSRANNVNSALLFATTREEIKKVYLEGPDSCMSKHFGNLTYHPTEVYAAGDLAVAYCMRGERITARALCWPAKKIYSLLYGDAETLEQLLISAGYEEDQGDGLAGARLLLLPLEGTGPRQLHLPYIDNDYKIAGTGGCMVLTNSGLDAQMTSGVIDAPPVCENCVNYIWDGEDVDILEDGNTVPYTYCQNCVDAADTYCCEICNNTILTTDNSDLDNAYCLNCMQPPTHSIDYTSVCRGDEGYFMNFRYDSLLEGAMMCSIVREMLPKSELAGTYGDYVADLRERAMLWTSDDRIRMQLILHNYEYAVNVTTPELVAQ